VHPLVAKAVLLLVAAAAAAVVGIVRTSATSDLVAWVSAGGTFGIACVTLYLTRKVKEVHVLVNTRLTQALSYLGAAEAKIAASRATGQPVPAASDHFLDTPTDLWKAP
jgi:FAD/FMN-containing dehydrogenase